jgi:hypothetical protein
MSALWAALPTVGLQRRVGVAEASFFGLVLASHLSFSEQLLLGRVFRIAAICSLASCALKIGTGVDFVTMRQSSNPTAEALESEPGIALSRSQEYV